MSCYLASTSDITDDATLEHIAAAGQEDEAVVAKETIAFAQIAKSLFEKGAIR